MKKVIILFLAPIFVLVSCGKEGTTSSPSNSNSVTTVENLLTVVLPYTGLGDAGYNDRLMSAVTDFYEAERLSLNLSVKNPSSEDQVKQIIKTWAAQSVSGKSLLVLASGDFEAPLKQAGVSLASNQNIILFESSSTDLGENITSFKFQRYGIFYLAGLMAAPWNSAVAIMAWQGDALAKDAYNGFADGYATGGNTVTTKYIASDASGYFDTNAAYECVSECSNTFVLPLAGGANLGIYKYTMDNDDADICVFDTDNNSQATYAMSPITISIKVDSLLNNYLYDWRNGKLTSGNKVYGLDSEYVQMMFNWFYVVRFGDIFNDDEYWPGIYNSKKSEALSKEAAYGK